MFGAHNYYTLKTNLIRLKWILHLKLFKLLLFFVFFTLFLLNSIYKLHKITRIFFLFFFFIFFMLVSVLIIAKYGHKKHFFVFSFGFSCYSAPWLLATGLESIYYALGRNSSITEGPQEAVVPGSVRSRHAIGVTHQ